MESSYKDPKGVRVAGAAIATSRIFRPFLGGPHVQLGIAPHETQKIALARTGWNLSHRDVDRYMEVS